LQTKGGSQDRLPLHFLLAATTVPSDNVVTTLVEAYPGACCVLDKGGNLPIHIACQAAHVPDKVFTLILSMYPEGAYARNLGGMYPLHLAASNRDMETKKIALAALDRGTLYALFGHLACGELLATMFIVNHVIVGVSYGMKDPKECADDDDDGDDGRPSGDGGIGGKRVCKPTTMMGNTPMERTRMEAFCLLTLKEDQLKRM
jgi:hypothetical protein